jgi:hypothetical protein
MLRNGKSDCASAHRAHRSLVAGVPHHVASKTGARDLADQAALPGAVNLKHRACSSFALSGRKYRANSYA